MTDFWKKSLNTQGTYWLIKKTQHIFKDKYSQRDKYLWPFKNEWEPKRNRMGKNTHLTKIIQHLKPNYITRNSYHIKLVLHSTCAVQEGSFVIRVL